MNMKLNSKIEILNKKVFNNRGDNPIGLADGNNDNNSWPKMVFFLYIIGKILMQI